MQILHLVSEVSLVSLTITTPPPPTLLSRCVCCTFPRVQRMLSKNDTEMSFVTKRFGAPLEVSKPQPLRSRGDAVLTHSLSSRLSRPTVVVAVAAVQPPRPVLQRHVPSASVARTRGLLQAACVRYTALMITAHPTQAKLQRARFAPLYLLQVYSGNATYRQYHAQRYHGEELSVRRVA